MKYWRKPLDYDKIEVPHGDVQILKERCKGCEFCIEYCPRKVLVMSEEFNAKGYHFPISVRNGHCVNCNLCEMICPEFAIFSKPLPNGKLGEITEVTPDEIVLAKKVTVSEGGKK